MLTGNGMEKQIDLYWTFRSPYCYLVGGRLLDLVMTAGLTCRFKPVNPMAVKVKDFFKNMNPLQAPYVFMDIARTADMLGIPYAWPTPDPVEMDFATGAVAETQPYIARLTRLGVEANRRGRGIQFGVEVSRVLFGKVRDWHLGSHLQEAANRAGLNLDNMEQSVDSSSDFYDQIIAQNEIDLKAAGHWGTPLMVFEGEPFFGQDRFDLLRWRLTQRGVI
jgi:2-hydroxychromene-2-carboxylate isomerase